MIIQEADHSLQINTGVCSCPLPRKGGIKEKKKPYREKIT